MVLLAGPKTNLVEPTLGGFADERVDSRTRQWMRVREGGFADERMDSRTREWIRGREGGWIHERERGFMDAVRVDLQVQAKMEDQSIKVMEFAARQRCWEMEEEQAHQATMHRLRDEVHPPRLFATFKQKRKKTQTKYRSPQKSVPVSNSSPVRKRGESNSRAGEGLVEGSLLDA
eukprot:86634-Prorocentrum_minimum.AAC.1